MLARGGCFFPPGVGIWLLLGQTRSEESKFCNRNGIRGLDGGQAGPEIMSISISVNFQTCAIASF